MEVIFRNFPRCYLIMVDYSPYEIVDMIMTLGMAGNNYLRAAALYAQRFPYRRHPTEVTIQSLTARARTGRLRRERRGHAYDQNDVRVLVILAMAHLNPQISIRQIERQTGMPKSTVGRIFKKVKYYAYHITLTQALTPADCVARVQFCQWALNRIHQDADFFQYVLFSNEATFRNDGHLNRHNCHYWSEVNPHWFRPIDHQHRWSINVWCGIVHGYLIGPYFFNDTVTGLSFLELLRDDLPELLQDVDLATRRRMWIQLDGAPPHYAHIVRNFLDAKYPDRWIGRGGPVAWPARSPNLTSPDFYLWGFLKNVVFAEEPTTPDDMRQRIRDACAAIPRDVLLKTVTHFEKRLTVCTAANGVQLEPVLNG